MLVISEQNTNWVVIVGIDYGNVGKFKNFCTSNMHSGSHKYIHHIVLVFKQHDISSNETQ